MQSLRWQTGLACCAVPTLLLGAAALAQPPSGNGKQLPLEEIVVTATMLERTLDRVPASVSVIGEDQIQLGRQQLALDEALGRVPGLFMQNRYNFAQDLRVSIRGFGARAQFGIRGVKVLVDGIPETLPDGQGSVDSIDLGATSQIEVIRGPSSSLYGNASGGVISVVSEGSGAEPFAQARVTGGSYGYQKLQFKTGGTTDRLNYLVSLSDSELEGYRAQSAAENQQLTGRFDLDLGNDRELLTVVNFTDQPVSDDAGGITAAMVASDPRAAWPANVQFDAGEALEQTRLGFVYSQPVGDRGSLSARNYYAWRDFGNLLPVQPGGAVDLDRAFVGGGLSYTYEGFLFDRPNRFVTGVDFDDQDDDRTRYNNNNGVAGDIPTFDQNEHVTSQGLFIQNELSVSERVQLTLGVRFDQVEFDVTDRFLADGDDTGTLQFEDTSPMMGLIVDITDRLNFYSTVSSAFETPTTTELNQPFLTSGGFNDVLSPQTAENFEIGLRGEIGMTQRYEVALFTIDVDDELIPYPVFTEPGGVAVPGRNFYQNAAQSTRDGLEFSWIANPTERLSATVSYAYSDFKFENFVDANNADFSGRVIPGTAENVLYGELAYTAPGGWFIAGEAIYTDEQYGDNGNTGAGLVEDYTLATVRFGYDLDFGDFTLSPFLGVNNLLDETYTSNVRLNAFGGRYFEPGPGRNGYAGITLDWKFR
jgi:iron complex outermembrane receptor protein